MRKAILSILLALVLSINACARAYMPDRDVIVSNEFGYHNLTRACSTMYIDKGFVICGTQWLGEQFETLELECGYVYRWVEINWENRTVNISDSVIESTEKEIIKVRGKTKHSRNRNDMLQYYGYLTQSGYVRFIDERSIKIVRVA